MPSASKNKEYRHLTKIIPLLDSWWGEKFQKVPASGALRWGTGHWTYADIVPPSSLPFIIECKHHVEVELDEILRKDHTQGRITWFWYHCTIPAALRATEEHKSPIYPLLIYKQNAVANRLVLQFSLFNRLPSRILSLAPYLYCHIPNASPFVVVDLEKFLVNVPRPVFEEYILGRKHDASTNN